MTGYEVGASGGEGLSLVLKVRKKKHLFPWVHLIRSNVYLIALRAWHKSTSFRFVACVKTSIVVESCTTRVRRLLCCEVMHQPQWAACGEQHVLCSSLASEVRWDENSAGDVQIGSRELNLAPTYIRERVNFFPSTYPILHCIARRIGRVSVIEQPLTHGYIVESELQKHSSRLGLEHAGSSV